ncbi:MAG: glycosyltransferase [Bacteroidetes bacterium]|nr:glycosyltransferase [Bacteroidota bacterium]
MSGLTFCQISEKIVLRILTCSITVTLSVIIVNYNVKYFLEQCLCSVEKAIATDPHLIQTEIFVVDNHSSDGSMDYLRYKFPGVQFFSNAENTGFAKANNQALAKATGKYILFLNPDTIIAEDSITICIAFMKTNRNAGAIGVRMIDGNGNFLKESKRGFPSSWASFCKLSGLTALFPHSKLFASYYMGHLNQNINHQVDILSGAFMLIRKELLDKTGGFDEQFFMYAEDIDLSYRMQQAGYRNYYLASTTIIHFKGESTRKDLHYVKLFYKAMVQFMRKHISSSHLILLPMQIAVWFRSKIAALVYFFPAKRQEKKIYTTFLKGDKKNMELLRSSIPIAERNIVENIDQANEIIFCEGSGLSFKNIIESIQQQHKSVSFKIHAGNSHSLVGSDFKNKNGEAIAIN